MGDIKGDTMSSTMAHMYARIKEPTATAVRTSCADG